MTVYRLSPETLRSQRVRFAFVVVILACGWLYALHKFVLTPGHDKMSEAAGNLVIAGGFLGIWIGFGFLGLYEAAHGFGTIKIGDDWIKLPGRDKIQFSEISSIEMTKSYVHPEFVLKLNDGSRFRRQTSITVNPRLYRDAQALTARLAHILD